MKAETQLLRAAQTAHEEIAFFLSFCDAKEIRQSFMPFQRVDLRLIGAIARYRREQKRTHKKASDQ